MKTLICGLAAATLSMPLSAASLTQGERDRALSELHASRKQFLDSIQGLTPAQWTFKADDKSWSIAECAEHIALSEDVLLGRIQTKILTGEAQPGRKPTVPDEMVLKMLNDRSHKAQAPEMLVPTHRWATKEELAAHFRESRERTLDYVRSTNDDLRSHAAPHPVGTLDAYQWVLLISGHTQRHTAQIEEVKTNPNYPKK